MMNKLSIIVPCYNVDKYLARCLDSLLAQTLDGIEIICINDGSPDNCIDIIRSYKKKYPDRIVVIDKENSGVWRARRDGIAAATGEYIGFLDPDDYVRNDFAYRLYEAAKSSDADIACCGFDRIDESTGKAYSREMTRFRYKSFDIKNDPGLLLEVNAAVWNKIFRAELLKGMREMASIPKALDDMVFAHLIYMNARTITFVNESLVYYTVRDNSIINGLNEEYIPGIYRSVCELRQIYAEDAASMVGYLDTAIFLHVGISMLHRLSFKDGISLGDVIKDNTRFLDKRFPLWRKSPYIRLLYVIRHHGANLKLYMVRRIYGLQLFRQFLLCYGFMIRRLGIDIKW